MSAKINKSLVLAILDGWGISPQVSHNAIALARTPCYDRLWRDYPHAALSASADAVGLPAGQMGNSEIGHLTIGSGQVMPTDLVRISEAIKRGELANNPALRQLFSHVKRHRSTLHTIGLVSNGGVHSHQDHLHAFLATAKAAGVYRVAIHAVTDGRDTPPQSAVHFLKQLEHIIGKIGLGFIATASGRFYAMDRDHHWDRLARAEAALFDCQGKICQLKSPAAAFEELNQAGVLDEHAEPLVFLDSAGRAYPISANDGVFFFNFRADRARQLSQRILKRTEQQNLCFVTMTRYDENFPCPVAFPPLTPATTLAAEISQAGLTQVHIAETEKYAHVTYFFNGGRQQPYPRESHVLIPSRSDVVTYDQAPEMRASAVIDHAVKHLNQGTNFILLNLANADMVGHTANRSATIQAIETVDRELNRLLAALVKADGLAVITADHGNAETIIDPATGQPHTAHTTNEVPFIITDPKLRLQSHGTLADVAPTVLTLLGLAPPRTMSGHNLLINS